MESWTGILFLICMRNFPFSSFHIYSSLMWHPQEENCGKCSRQPEEWQTNWAQETAYWQHLYLKSFLHPQTGNMCLKFQLFILEQICKLLSSETRVSLKQCFSHCGPWTTSFRVSFLYIWPISGPHCRLTNELESVINSELLKPCLRERINMIWIEFYD